MSASKEEVVPMTSDEAAAHDALRATLQRVGVVFEFSVRRVAGEARAVDEARHRAVLRRLGEEIMARAERHWREAMAQNPSLQPASFDAQLAFDVASARATRLDAAAVVAADSYPPNHRIAHTRDLDEVDWFEWLCQAFGDPPYPLTVAHEAERATLFPRFCEAIGLLPDEGLVLLDWVGDPEREPERSMWSAYFEDGKEWWGIWCFTVWNPLRGTLAAVMASTTD